MSAWPTRRRARKLFRSIRRDITASAPKNIGKHAPSPGILSATAAKGGTMKSIRARAEKAGKIAPQSAAPTVTPCAGSAL